MHNTYAHAYAHEGSSQGLAFNPVVSRVGCIVSINQKSSLSCDVDGVGVGCWMLDAWEYITHWRRSTT